MSYSGLGVLAVATPTEHRSTRLLTERLDPDSVTGGVGA